MNKSKSMLTSKTFWANVITFLIALLGLLAGQEWIKANPDLVATILMATSILNVILRRVTGQPAVFPGEPTK